MIEEDKLAERLSHINRRIDSLYETTRYLDNFFDEFEKWAHHVTDKYNNFVNTTKERLEAIEAELFCKKELSFNTLQMIKEGEAEMICDSCVALCHKLMDQDKAKAENQ